MKAIKLKHKQIDNAVLNARQEAVIAESMGQQKFLVANVKFICDNWNAWNSFLLQEKLATEKLNKI